MEPAVVLLEYHKRDDPPKSGKEVVIGMRIPCG